MTDPMNDLIELQALQRSIAAAAAKGTLSSSAAPELERLLTIFVGHARAAGLDLETELVEPLVDWGKSEVLAHWITNPERDRTPYLAVFGVVAAMQERFG